MISIIIPVFNSEKTIRYTLEGLENQTIRDFEVIIVDDGSTDSSSKLINDFFSQNKYKATLMHQKNAGPAKARNLGALKADGEILLFLDSDCVTPDNWIKEMIWPLGNNVVGSNCGYKVRNAQYLIARYIDYEIAYRHKKLKNKKINTVGTYSACILKRVFKEIGGFDTTYKHASGEDFDLAFTISKLKYEFVFTDRTFVYHFHPETLKKFLKQQYGRGYWRFWMYIKHKDRILKGDSYTGMEAQAQFLLSNVFFLSVILIIINPLAVLLGSGLLVLSNIPLGVWIFKTEKKFIIFAPLIASVRSIAGTLGVYKAFADACTTRLRKYNHP
jgi:glycosyltransferase involved in cell wall biosynthesis